jgi:hypothetical protein
MVDSRSACLREQETNDQTQAKRAADRVSQANL